MLGILLLFFVVVGGALVIMERQAAAQRAALLCEEALRQSGVLYRQLANSHEDVSRYCGS
jgi:hypothetical protein